MRQFPGQLTSPRSQLLIIFYDSMRSVFSDYDFFLNDKILKICLIILACTDIGSNRGVTEKWDLSIISELILKMKHNNTFNFGTFSVTPTFMLLCINYTMHQCM